MLDRNFDLLILICFAFKITGKRNIQEIFLIRSCNKRQCDRDRRYLNLKKAVFENSGTHFFRSKPGADDVQYICGNYITLLLRQFEILKHIVQPKS